MAYNELEQYTLDINWYFTDHYNRICIAASAGGLLPKPIIENDEGNEEFHKIVNELPIRFKVTRNENILDQIQGISNQNLDSYFQDFENLAGRGLYVFDKLKIDDPEDGFYLLIAYPNYDTNIDSYPVEKGQISLIPKTKQSIISRRNQKVSDSNFTPIDLVQILNNTNRQ
jgi:hypothetical protein